MPYKTNKELPERIRHSLPQGAQTIFRKVYNSTDEQYNDTVIANKVAWSAVKRKYAKKGDKWVKK